VGSLSAPDLRPMGGARLAVGLAARMLPTPAERRRYQAEFVAELHGLPPAAQLRYAAGVPTSTPALRTALSREDTPIEEVVMPSLGRRFRCRVLRWHDWQVHSTEDGERYRSCAVCHTDHQGELEIPNSFRLR